MQVVLSTWKKFHFFHLARQMERRGWLSQIFTTFPYWKLKDEGLSRDKIFDYAMYEILEAVLHRAGINTWSVDWSVRLAKQRGYDKYIVRHIKPCDVYIGLSGSGLVAGRHVQARGGKHICERSSAHISFSMDILKEEFARWNLPFDIEPPQVIIEREIQEYENADHVVVPSHFNKETFVKYGIPADKITVNSWGADFQAFESGEVRSRDEFNILFAGFASIRKGIPYLIDAFHKFDHPRKKLWIAGAVRPELKDYLRTANLDGVEFLGTLPGHELRDRMNRAHAFVIPSVEEGLARVIGEALACGCPVIGTFNSGASDLVDDGVEGFIVPIRDPAAIADRLAQLAGDRVLLEEMSAAGVKRVKAMGGWDSYGAGYEALCRRLTGTADPSRASA